MLTEAWGVTSRLNEYDSCPRVIYAGPEIAEAINKAEAGSFNADDDNPYESVIEIQCWVNGENVASMIRYGLFAFERNHGPVIPEIEALYEVEK